MAISAELEIGEALAQSAKGDRSAFERLVRAYQSTIFSLAYHSLRDAAEAEEIAQEVFLELYRHIDSIETPAHLTYWLRKVATRKCIDRARRERRRPRFSIDEAPEPLAVERHSDALLSEALRKLVASLPEIQREVIILRFQEELEPAAIAQVLDIPVNTVKSHLQRALALLRQKLERSGKVVSL